MTTKVWPMPELLHGDVYEVRESPHKTVVCTDLEHKVMLVPSEDTEMGRMGRLHEMGHVAITPIDGLQRAQDEGIEMEYVNVAEDLRLHRYLNDHFDLDRAFPDKLLSHRIEGWHLENDFKTMVLMTLACHFTPDGRFFMDTLSNLDYEWWYKVRDFIERYECWLWEDWSFEATLRIAKDLQDIFKSPLAPDLSKMNKDDFEQTFSWSGETGEWGKMNIIEHPLPIPTGARRLVRKVKPQESGSTMMFPTRLDVDDKIFGTIKKVPGGTILIDVSSSMSLTGENIEELLKAAPGATVAIYSGRMQDGLLQIVAKKGRMANMARIEYPGANVIDGPALNWLTHQNEPRIWLCDGMVTGVNDTNYINLTREAKAIVANNRITRADTVGETIRLLKTKV